MYTLQAVYVLMTVLAKLFFFFYYSMYFCIFSGNHSVMSVTITTYESGIQLNMQLMEQENGGKVHRWPTVLNTKKLISPLTYDR